MYAQETEIKTVGVDSAAAFGAAISLWRVCHEAAARDPHLNLSDCYNGIDQFMREVMRIGNSFEEWACRHIAFEEQSEVWPYLLEDNFGAACLAVILPGGLAQFDDSYCLRVALRLRLPIRAHTSLRLPIDVAAQNPVAGSVFRAFRIQTVRDALEEGLTEPFTVDDNPSNEGMGEPYYSLYGVAADGILEHIADRQTYAETVTLASKLAPGIDFPPVPILFGPPDSFPVSKREL